MIQNTYALILSSGYRISLMNGPCSIPGSSSSVFGGYATITSYHTGRSLSLITLARIKLRTLCGIKQTNQVYMFSISKLRDDYLFVIIVLFFCPQSLIAFSLFFFLSILCSSSWFCFFFSFFFFLIYM